MPSPRRLVLAFAAAVLLALTVLAATGCGAPEQGPERTRWTVKATEWPTVVVYSWPPEAYASGTLMILPEVHPDSPPPVPLHPHVVTCWTFRGSVQSPKLSTVAGFGGWIRLPIDPETDSAFCAHDGFDLVVQFE